MKHIRSIFFAALPLILALAAFAGCSKKTAEPATASGRNLVGEIRFSWWGNEARNTATIEAIRFYESQHPGVTIIPEFTAFDGYYNKLMSQLAAGNAPDIFTMNPEWLSSIVDAGGLSDITGLVDVRSHNPQIASACSVNGKMYGVNVSLNANIILYNKTVAEELGIQMPEGDYTWDDLINILAQVYQSSGKKIYGMPDQRMKGGLETFLPAWCLTHLGKEPPFPWTGTEILITSDDVAAFMDYFNKVPEGVILPPDESALLGGANDQHIGQRKTFCSFEYSGTFGMFQSQTLDELSMIEYPNNHKGKGVAVSARPGLVEGVSSRSKNKALAVDFLNWFANSPDAALILKNVRGVLPSAVQREALLANSELLTVPDQKISAIINQIYGKAINPYAPGPIGVSSLFSEQYMRLVGQEVAFGLITPRQAGHRFEELKEEITGR
ncbi:MAG: extracellular solute-binding protein [Treponema sp.]|jgi:multiple sugar transport system substrate-binding protein|nr:extracellular solute-binding protein [Treponema sp.]